MEPALNELSKAYLPGVFAFITALVGALFALVGVAITNYFSTRNNNKNLFIDTVTKERASWRGEMRTHVASFCKLAREHYSSSVPSVAPTLHESRVHILLRLNPNPSHALDAGLIKGIGDTMLALNTKDDAALEAALAVIEKNAQALLKQEWDKSKREALSGKVEAA